MPPRRDFRLLINNFSMTSQPDSIPSLAFVRNGIIDFFRNQDIRADHVLDLIDFQSHQTVSWSAAQKAALEPAIVALMQEGILSNEQGYIVLTDAGFRLIYLSQGQDKPGF